MQTPVHAFESEAITQERSLMRKKQMDDETGADISPVCVSCSVLHITFRVLERFVREKMAIEQDLSQKKVHQRP